MNCVWLIYNPLEDAYWTGRSGWSKTRYKTYTTRPQAILAIKNAVKHQMLHGEKIELRGFNIGDSPQQKEVFELVQHDRWDKQWKTIS